MRIQFTVTGRPPRKGGALSMWGQASEEAPRVACLREKAFQAMKRAGLLQCLDTPVSLEITMCVAGPRLEEVGDLDTFVAGVCDALQATHPNALRTLNEVFAENRTEIHPSRPLVIRDDKKVVFICARKVALDEGQQEHYHVVVEDLEE